MSFLVNYMRYTSGSEVPENYHFWSGIYAISCIVNRQVWISMGSYNLYPNLYIVLLGPPGNGKSLAMDTAQVLVEDIGCVPTSGDAQTKESMCKHMREKCVRDVVIDNDTLQITPFALFATELSHLLGPNSGHMIDFLTTIYTKDKRYVTMTKNKGDDIIIRPWLGLIACTTQDWITTYLKSDIIGGGFTRRVIFVNEALGASVDDKSLRKPFIIQTPEHALARQNVMNYAEILRGVKGEFKWEPGAKAAYEKWYLTRDIPSDPDTIGYHKTKPNQVLKVAMLIALSESPDCLLKKLHFDVAMALFDKTETTLTKVFQGIGRNELNAIANKVLEFVSVAPEMDINYNGVKSRCRIALEAKIRTFMYRDAPGRECDDIINHLVASEKIFRYNHAIPGRVAPIRYLGLKDSLVQVLDKTQPGGGT